MDERYLDLALADRREVLDIAASASGRPAYLLEKDVWVDWVNYRAAVAGSLRLVPAGEALTVLADDYARMVEDGWLLDDAEPFDTLMDACQSIEDRANGRD